VTVTQGLLVGRVGYVSSLGSSSARLSMQEGALWVSVKPSEIIKA
jgi:hypothetical protein